MDQRREPGEGNSKSMPQSGFFCRHLQELSSVRFRTKQLDRGDCGERLGDERDFSPLPLRESQVKAQHRSHPVQGLNLAWLQESRASRVLFAEIEALP